VSFSASPCGGYSDGIFGGVGDYSNLWSANEYNNFTAYTRGMSDNNDLALWGITGKHFLFSVRCLKD